MMMADFASVPMLEKARAEHVRFSSDLLLAYLDEERTSSVHSFSGLS